MKKSINNFIAIGTCTDNPVLTLFGKEENKIAKATWTIAIDRNQDDESKQQADYFKCEMTGRIAEIACELIKQGNLIYIEAEIRNDRVVKETINYYMKLKIKKFLILNNKE